MTIRPEEVALELPLTAVDVWYLYTDTVTSPIVVERYEKMMSPDERVRRDRFVFAKHRHQFLVTRGLLRTIVSRYIRIRPEECVFVTNRYGKPFLRHGSPSQRLDFNMSHTNGLAAIAIAVGRDVGIDVEGVTQGTTHLAVRRYFSSVEVTALVALPQAEQISRFFSYWTLKEAYIKARGMGLSIPLESFSINIDGNRSAAIEFGPSVDDDASAWQFGQYDLGPRYRMALAIRRRGEDIPVRVARFEAGDESA